MVPGKCVYTSTMQIRPEAKTRISYRAYPSEVTWLCGGANQLRVHTTHFTLPGRTISRPLGWWRSTGEREGGGEQGRKREKEEKRRRGEEETHDGAVEVCASAFLKGTFPFSVPSSRRWQGEDVSTCSNNLLRGLTRCGTAGGHDPMNDFIHETDARHVPGRDGWIP